MQPQLVGAVGIEIQRLAGQRLAAAQEGLGDGQLAPDRAARDTEEEPPNTPCQ